METEVAILFSGGLESTALINHYKKLNYKIYLLYVKFGYTWEDAEFANANKIANFYNLQIDSIDYSNLISVKQLGHVNTINQNIIPLRNLSLIVLSTLKIYSHNINILSFGLQGNSNYPDTSLEYIRKTEELIRQGLQNDKFKIALPFYGMSKDEIYGNNRELPIQLVFSCTNPIGYSRCHKCYKCKILDSLKKKYLV